MASAIAVSGLAKDFGSTRALDHLYRTVRTGRCTASWVLTAPADHHRPVLLGLLRRDGGTVTLLVGDPWRDAVTLHHRLAYVPGEVNLWPNLSGGEVIDLLGALRGGLGRAGHADLLERFQPDPAKRCRAYSKGNRQKVALVAAFASDVELHLLDEPTSGLDPLMEGVFKEVVQELREAGRTVLLSSHILSEVEALCDRVTIVRAGPAVESGTFDELGRPAAAARRARTAPEELSKTAASSPAAAITAPRSSISHSTP